MNTVSDFISHHYRHFNAASLKDAAEGYKAHLEKGGKMLVTVAGAMSTAELGLSLAEMIRQDKVHAICCTGANLEEDVFNLVAHDHYRRIPKWRELKGEDEQALLDQHLNRVTDTCIPEGEAMRRIEKAVLEEWVNADQVGRKLFPHEFFYEILRDDRLKASYQIDPKDSWLYAAMKKNLPMFVPGWEDSTLGNMYAGHCIDGHVKNVHTVRTGIEYMISLADGTRGQRRNRRSAFSRLPAALQAISRYASFQCFTRICGGNMSRDGVISVRSAIRRPATDPIRARFPTKRLPGASFLWKRRNILLSRMRQSSRP